MLTEKTRKVSVSSEAVVGDYTYSVTHEVIDNKLINLMCAVSKKVLTDTPTPTGMQQIAQAANVGSMNKINGQKTFNLNETEDVIAHLTHFEQIVAEIESGLTATRKAVKA